MTAQVQRKRAQLSCCIYGNLYIIHLVTSARFSITIWLWCAIAAYFLNDLREDSSIILPRWNLATPRKYGALFGVSAYSRSCSNNNYLQAHTMWGARLPFFSSLTVRSSPTPLLTNLSLLPLHAPPTTTITHTQLVRFASLLSKSRKQDKKKKDHKPSRKRVGDVAAAR